MKEKENEIGCCVRHCENPLDQAYWDAQWNAKQTGWDIGHASPAITEFMIHYPNKDAQILIPGCGNAHEAEFLVSAGFTNLTLIDIAPQAVKILQEKFKTEASVSVICADFFEHEGEYDVIIEQTFFCALAPRLRQRYVWKMHQLLKENGILTGLLFNREFTVSPPFGGNKEEYAALFKGAFHLEVFDTAINSIPQRSGSELFIHFKVNKAHKVSLYHFKGITCSGCQETVSAKFSDVEGVLSVSMNTDFSEVIIVSKEEIGIEVLQEIVSYDEKYKIEK